jgi:2,3-bisphosphoglycerate-independent phosphoglycerate mutase
MLRVSVPVLPTYPEVYDDILRIAIYGMYRRVACWLVWKCWMCVTASPTNRDLKHAGMILISSISNVKKTDTCGENGDFMGKVRAIESVDALLPRLLALQPDVLSSAAITLARVLKAHSRIPSLS